jgi:hypothetical protein
MKFTDDERVQEIFLIIGDKVEPVHKAWWYVLGVFIFLSLPMFFVLEQTFFGLTYDNYEGPKIIYQSVEKVPLEVLEKKIFEFPDKTYAGYIRVKNINLEWGVPEQVYTAEFKTYGGTVVSRVSGKTFILPASEKMIIISRFNANQKPDTIDFSLADSHFVHKTDTYVELRVERVNVTVQAGQQTVSAAVKNMSPFVVRQVSLPVAIFNNRKEIVGVNYTNINELKPDETRSFQFTWPNAISGAVRAEINPEINIFDRNLIYTETGDQPVY